MPRVQPQETSEFGIEAVQPAPELQPVYVAPVAAVVIEEPVRARVQRSEEYVAPQPAPAITRPVIVDVVETRAPVVEYRAPVYEQPVESPRAPVYEPPAEGPRVPVIDVPKIPLVYDTPIEQPSVIIRHGDTPRIELPAVGMAAVQPDQNTFEFPKYEAVHGAVTADTFEFPKYEPIHSGIPINQNEEMGLFTGIGKIINGVGKFIAGGVKNVVGIAESVSPIKNAATDYITNAVTTSSNPIKASSMAQSTKAADNVASVLGIGDKTKNNFIILYVIAGVLGLIVLIPLLFKRRRR